MIQFSALPLRSHLPPQNILRIFFEGLENISIIKTMPIFRAFTGSPLSIYCDRGLHLKFRVVTYGQLMANMNIIGEDTV